MMLSVAAAASPVHARADDTELAREQYRRGMKAFKAGQFEDAIDAFSRAYVGKPEPALLYNLAEAHRVLGHDQEALRAYRDYLQRAPEARNREDVEAKCAMLEEAIAKRDQAATESPKPAEAGKPAVPATEKLAVVTVEKPRPIHDHQALSKRMWIAGLATAGVGVVLLGVGIGYAAEASRAGADVSRLAELHLPYDPARDADGRRYDTTGIALLAVGGAATVAGALTFGLSYRERRRK
jgi:tetratricopeptide (TPR) repeat protein